MKFNPFTGNFDFVNPATDLSDYYTESEVDTLLSGYIPTSDYADFVNVTGDTMTGALRVSPTGFNAVGFEIETPTESNPRFAILNRGDLAWGPGDAGYDTYLTRALGGVLDIQDSLQLGGSFVFQGGTSGVIGFGFFEDGSLRLENNYSLGTDEFYIDILDSTGAREQLYRAFTASTGTPINYIQFWGFETATGTLQVGGGFGIHSARLAVDQDGDTRAIPVVYLEQTDVSEEIFEIVSTAGTGNAIEAVGSKTLTTTGFMKCTINGSTVYIPFGTIA